TLPPLRGFLEAFVALDAWDGRGERDRFVELRRGQKGFRQPLQGLNSRKRLINLLSAVKPYRKKLTFG
ncbi:MAG: hypothetical protein ACLFTV_15740, partial [Desulfococcaceae bacterium]